MAYYIDNEVEEILELEPCNIDKIGSKYKEYFKEYKLDKYYCLNKVNHTLKAYIYLNYFNGQKKYKCRIIFNKAEFSKK